MAPTTLTCRRKSWRLAKALIHARAFTVLELLIVCALAAILLAYAVPSYRSYVQRIHRGQAIEALLSSASCQERHFARSFSYDTRICQPGNNGQHYAFSFDPADTDSSATFRLSASPLPAQAGDVCGTLVLDQSGERSITGPVGQLRRCWEGR
jgi:type IV pilus assembly protein PilE